MGALLSSTETGYIVLSSATKEAIYIQDLVFRVWLKIIRIMQKANIINLKWHHVHDNWSKAISNIDYIPTQGMFSDILTKKFI